MQHHEGERSVQLRAGWMRDGWGSVGVTAEVPAVAREFLRSQQMIVITAVGEGAAPWATVLTGPPGFAEATGDRTVVVHSLPGPGDPLAAALDTSTDVGMIAIEPQTRRRLRVNGRSSRSEDGLVIHTDQAYANCPKYIQVRHLAASSRGNTAVGPARTTAALTTTQQAWIAEADTFFVGTYAIGHGADASHRGGNPGFVKVLGSRRLVWPDYVGNSMYMTLGNLELSSACGLLFLDWTHGHALHVTGTARTNWSPDAAAGVPGAKRLIEFTVDQVIQIDHASPLRWTFGEYFRHNPPTT